MIETLSSGVLARFLYDARKRAWVRIDALSLTDEAPLAERGSIGLASCLAGVLSDDYGAVLGPDATKRAALFMWGLSSRYDSQRVSAQQSYF
jgi:hypothetical protein